MSWVRYAAAKVARALFVIWAAYSLSFALLYLLPVKAVDLLFDPQELLTISNATKQQVAAEYGFNKPALVQYGDRLWAALHGNFGTSVQTGAPVWKAIGGVLPPTLVLAAAALVLALLISFGIAFFAANSRHPWLVNLVEALPSATVSIPVFLIGLIAIQIFSFDLHWFPPLGDQGFGSLVLPMFTLAIPVAGPISQLLVNSFQREFGAPYVATSLAKGGTRSWVIRREVFRNASLPALTIAGITFGNILAGAVITETIFSRTGLGRLTQAAVGSKDIPVIQGIVVLTAGLYAITNLVVDFIYPILDPRLKARIVAG
jgi:peptide/nickel transport system permease protein